MLPVGGGRGRGDKGTIGEAGGRGSGCGQDPVTARVTVGGLSEEIARSASQKGGRGYSGRVQKLTIQCSQIGIQIYIVGLLKY